MQAITVSDRDAGVAGLSLTELPYPQAADNDVVVRVHAAGFTRGELDWPHTWIDRAGHDRTPSVPGHELSGVVVELGYGTTLLSVGQRVFGLADWARNGSLAEYTAVEARNLAPLPMDIDHTVAAALPISGLAAWQGLFDHGRLAAGQTVLIHGAAGGVGSIAVQLAREVGARVIGTGRTADRDRAGELGVHTFLDLETEKLEDAGEVDVVFDVIGGERPRPIGRSGAGWRNARHHRRAAEDPAARRAGSLLPCRSRSRPARRPRRASTGWTPQAGRGRRAATRRSCRRIRSRQAHSWQDDPARSRRLKGASGDWAACTRASTHSVRSHQLAVKTSQGKAAKNGPKNTTRRTDRCGDARACGPRRADAREFGSKPGCPTSFQSTYQCSGQIT